MVTAELAVAVPAVVALIALAMGGVAAGVEAVRCADAVRMGARAAARGDPDAVVREVVAARARVGTQVAVARGGGEVRVSARGPAPPTSLGLWSGCRASATALVEDAPP